MQFPAVLHCGWFCDLQLVSSDALSDIVTGMRGGADLGRLFISSPLDQRGVHCVCRCFPGVTWLGRGNESGRGVAAVGAAMLGCWYFAEFKQIVEPLLCRI